ncbi:MAG TPA: hypothetical protein VK211_23290 [Kamptonema sp.]|nr:hypothetical protein [Kamptonema sp.]
MSVKQINVGAGSQSKILTRNQKAIKPAPPPNLFLKILPLFTTTAIHQQKGKIHP